eukprot:scaffold489_cov259-Pinguiococcus_pyrenoidosus.AAC.17
MEFPKGKEKETLHTSSKLTAPLSSLSCRLKAMSSAFVLALPSCACGEVDGEARSRVLVKRKATILQLMRLMIIKNVSYLCEIGFGSHRMHHVRLASSSSAALRQRVGVDDAAFHA